ncbi:unnamed protein product, partial [Brassica rapa subsp. narinosa]
MGDKEKNQYSLWNSEETKVLIELLVEGIQRGWRDSNGIMNKATVEHKILPVLNERLGCQKTHKHYQSRIKFLKGQYQCYVDLLNNSSGFGWDPIMKRFVASNEVWNDYLKVCLYFASFLLDILREQGSLTAIGLRKFLKYCIFKNYFYCILSIIFF